MIDSKSFVGTFFMYLLLSSAYLWEIYGSPIAFTKLDFVHLSG